MGCQKGASWSHCHYSQDRVTHPLKRVGERGEGKFERVSWDAALTDIADGILDAIQTEGAASVINLFTPRSARHRRACSPRRSACRRPTATPSSRTSAPAGT